MIPFARCSSNWRWTESAFANRPAWPRGQPFHFLLTLLWLSVWPLPAATFRTLAENGPSSNRLDIVFLAEGYTGAQSEKFFSDATNALNGLLAHEPFATYRTAFNAYGLHVASTQSGSDHFGVNRNTYFNSSYDPVADFIITIPLNDQGQGKIDSLLQAHKPDADLAVLLVNDPIPGGSDGFGRTAIVSIGFGTSDLLAHEVGHVLGGLGDEYDTPYPGFPDVEEPNTTRETQRDRIKWNAWIAPETPVPTPATFDYEQTVGLFEGAHYHSTGWYRPKFDCKMNHPSVGFCEVCSEALILAIYAKVRPVDGATPAQSTFEVSGPAPIELRLNLVTPFPNTLHIAWHTNGVPLAGAAGNHLLLSPSSLSPGTNVITAIVFDATERVRSDPANLRTQVIAWTLDVRAIPDLRLAQPHRTPADTLAFEVTGAAGPPVVIDSSSTLQGWTPILTNSSAAASFWFTNSASAASQFFRARRL